MFDEAMKLAVEQSYSNLQYEIMNDKGWLYIQKKQYAKARSLFLRLLDHDLSPYLTSLALQNIGYLEYERGNYHEAIAFHSRSLPLTTHHEMRDMAFEDYYKLGLCYEHLQELGLADHFYAMGYRELRQEIELGLRVMGYRKKLLDAYITFLQRRQKPPEVNLQDKVFGFAMDRSLAEIRAIFHKHLFLLHRERTPNTRELCRRLGIDRRTYFHYQKRLGLKEGLGSRESLTDNPYFKEYLESLTPYNWREANQRFESDLFAFLLPKHHFNKKHLAQQLGVSYALVAQKTR
jgi:tetratricopeptide (TPR) repeat protein